jgi:threonine dehydratase
VDEGDIEQGGADAAGDREDPGRGRGCGRPGGADPASGERFKGKRVGLVLSGGNIDPLLLAAIIERGMVRAGRLARVRVSARDVPGSLAEITATVAEAGANIDEVHHQRAFTMLAAQNVDIELVLQTRGRAHLASVLTACEGRRLRGRRAALKAP